MCGFAGFTYPLDCASSIMAESPGMASRESQVKQRLHHMLGTIAHRGPDQRGVKVASGVALGHQRLSVMVPSGGYQPRIDDRSGCALLYNGELYGHFRWRAQLSPTTVYRDACDTETLFQMLLQQTPARVLPSLRGMFAFAFLDARTQTLTLARDRFGEKPLYYAYVKGELIFGSEIKALQAHPALQRVTLDWPALLLYTMMEYVPGADTGLVEIKELPSGHCLTFDVQRKIPPRIEAYWSLDTLVTDTDRSPIDYVKQLEQQLSATVEDQLEADRSLGVFLSGGVDSSLIAALCTQHRDRVQTFTVRFPFRSYDESAYAEQVARVLRTEHQTIALSQQTCLAGLETLMRQTDTPFADSSWLPTYLLCQAASGAVTVALGGDGADELFLGYPNFRLQGITKLLARMPLVLGHWLNRVLEWMPASSAYMNWSFLLRQLSQGFGRPAHAQSFYWMAPMVPAHQHALVKDLPASELNPVFESLGAKIDALFPRPSACLAGTQRFFIEQYLPYDILFKTDRASMFNSLEVRSPFLDVDLFGLIQQSSHFLSARANIGKSDLKHLLRQHLPAEFVERKKHGFAMPVAQMLRNEFRSFWEEMVLPVDNPMYAFFDETAVRQLWQQHLLEQRNHGKVLWMLFWLAVFLKKQA